MMIPDTPLMQRMIVTKSFYMTFDGKRCYCEIPDLLVDNKSMSMQVQYNGDDQETYTLSSQDSVNYSGAHSGASDDSRVEFTRYQHGNTIILSGMWKCGGREGEWYIEGLLEKDFMPNVQALAFA